MSNNDYCRSYQILLYLKQSHYIDHNASMGLLHKYRRGESPKAMSGTDAALDRPTEAASESSLKPSRHRRDWRPDFDKKMQGMLFSFGASWDLASNSNVVKMGEAHHACAIESEDMNNITQIGNGYYMKATSAGADFDPSPIEEARKQRIETLQRSIGRGGKLEFVSEKDNKSTHRNSTRNLEESRQECLDELLLLRNHVAPRRVRNQRTIETVKADEQRTPEANLPFTLPQTEGAHPDSPDPTSPKAVTPITCAAVRAVLGQRSSRQDSVSGWDSGTPYVTSTTNAALRRCESKYDGSPEEEEQHEENRGRRSLTNSIGTPTDLEALVDAGTHEPPENSWRRDSALAGLEEIKQGVAGEDGGEEPEPPKPSQTQSLSSLLDPSHLSDGGMYHPTKDDTPRQKTTRRHLEHEKRRLKSMVRGAGRRCTRRPTTAEKGKWPAECECSRCQPGRSKHVRFDSSAMDKAEDGPGLSNEGFVKMLRENRMRMRMEADPRGEGCSSWATSGPAELVGLDMFANPRPAPLVPVRRQGSFKVMGVERPRKRRVYKRDIGEPMERNINMKPRDRYNVFAPAREFLSPSAGEPAPVALDKRDGNGRRPIWRTLSQRFQR